MALERIENKKVSMFERIISEQRFLNFFPI